MENHSFVTQYIKVKTFYYKKLKSWSINEFGNF